VKGVVRDYTPTQEVFGYLLGENEKDHNGSEVAERELSSSRNIRFLRRLQPKR
jgi:hypothetical protein